MPIPSFAKFNYSLRPAKQVERKLLTESLLKLAENGYGIGDYTYLGFGSPFFVDFVLFHKYLYIDDMICIEREDIPKRMRFNCPYDFIKIRMKRAIEVVPALRRNKRYFVWLDYDYSLRPEVLDELDAFLWRLAPQSILVLTVDARPRLPEEEDNASWSEAQRASRVLNFYKNHFERLAGGSITPEDIDNKNRYPRTLARILRAKIADTLVGRRGIEFVQIFNFLYADRAPMLTLGGVIGHEGQGAGIRQALRSVPYVTSGEVSKKIFVPPLTLRERQWIDSHADGALAKVPFEIERGYVKAYRDYARYYPSYHEAVL